MLISSSTVYNSTGIFSVNASSLGIQLGNCRIYIFVTLMGPLLSKYVLYVVNITTKLAFSYVNVIVTLSSKISETKLLF